MDTGCTCTLVHAELCHRWSPGGTTMMTIDGQTFRCSGNACVRLTVPDSEIDAVDLQVMVVKQKPLGLDVILGIDSSHCWRV